jgi:sec-independent protein translocase protein TatA
VQSVSIKDFGGYMIGGLGPTELIIILVIVIILFGVGRISKVSGELGKSIRAFKDGLKSDEDEPVDNNKTDAK